MSNLIPVERIEDKIYLIRGQKVMLDYDLAHLYGVETKYLKRQVKRNIKRFPQDFMFQLSRSENLRCQNVTSSYGGRRYLSYAFTEQGVAMLSSVLNNEQAILVNIQIMRAFVKIKRILTSHRELCRKIEEMEKKYDHQFHLVFDAIKAMIAEPIEEKKRIGFVAGNK